VNPGDRQGLGGVEEFLGAQTKEQPEAYHYLCTTEVEMKLTEQEIEPAESPLMDL